VKVDGTAIFSNVAVTNYMPQAGSRFVWAARCDALSEEMRLDNIIVRTAAILRKSRQPARITGQRHFREWGLCI